MPIFPDFSNAGTWYSIKLNADSTSEASTHWPIPLFWRATTAMTVPNAA